MPLHGSASTWCCECVLTTVSACAVQGGRAGSLCGAAGAVAAAGGAAAAAGQALRGKPKGAPLLGCTTMETIGGTVIPTSCHISGVIRERLKAQPQEHSPPA